MEADSTFRGVNTPIQTLIHEISSRGWKVTKVDWKKAEGKYIAEAKNPYGEKLQATGPDPATAAAHLLHSIIRKEFVRQPTPAQYQMGYTGSRVSSWVHRAPELAEAYAKAPVFDPKAAAAWKELADDSVARFKTLQNHLHIEPTDDPHPYHTVKDLIEDITKKQHYSLTRANLLHPVWTPEQQLAFRAVHDILGHAVSGGGFDWNGINAAAKAHAKLLSPTAQRALAAERLMQSAHGMHSRFPVSNKIFLPKDDIYDADTLWENSPGHSGVHPHHSIPPKEEPGIEPRTAGVRLDPNHGWESGATQLPNAAYLHQGDPLGMVDTADTARKNESKWWAWETADGKPDIERMRQAVMNAFRAVLLSPRKNLKWNAIHYQDLSSIPYHVTDPKIYWDKLSQARDSWNMARGIDPEKTFDLKQVQRAKKFREAKEAYKAWYMGRHKDLTPDLAMDHAERELMNLQIDAENSILRKNPEGASVTGAKIEDKITDSVIKRIANLLKTGGGPDTDVPDNQISLFSNWVFANDPDWPNLEKDFSKPWPNIDLVHEAPPHITEAPGVQNSQYDPRRRPWIYSPEENHVWLGTPGQEHRDIAMEMKDHPGHPVTNRGFIVNPRGYTMIGPEPTEPGTEPDKNFVADTTFYDPQRNSDHPSVLEAIAAHTGTRAVGPNEINWGPLRDILHNVDDRMSLDDLLGEGHKSSSEQTGFNPSDTNQTNVFADERYGSFMGSHLKQIANLSQYADVITKAALEDVTNHDSNGKHFRATVLGLKIPGVGPKVCSFAWLLLCPMGSQLATVDVHMMDVLGRDYDKQMNPRDYFKYERELQAGRDAAGYGHMPLGQFQWAMWDNKRTGDQTHQDHSALAVDNPTHYFNVNWEPVQVGNNTLWLPPNKGPNWWQDTIQARQAAGESFDRDVAPKYPQTQIPWKEKHVPIHAPVMSGAQKSYEGEFHYALGIPEEIIKRIADWVGVIPMGTATEVIEPKDYHITIAYADKGWDNKRAHEIVNNAGLSGIQFRGIGLSAFDGEDDSKAVVIELDSPDWDLVIEPVRQRLRDEGLKLSEYEGGVKAHITIAYMPKLPEAPKFPLLFRAGEGYVSKPRSFAQEWDLFADTDYVSTDQMEKSSVWPMRKWTPPMTNEQAAAKGVCYLHNDRPAYKTGTDGIPRCAECQRTYQAQGWEELEQPVKYEIPTAAEQAAQKQKIFEYRRKRYPYLIRQQPGLFGPEQPRVTSIWRGLGSTTGSAKKIEDPEVEIWDPQIRANDSTSLSIVDMAGVWDKPWDKLSHEEKAYMASHEFTAEEKKKHKKKKHRDWGANPSYPSGPISPSRSTGADDEGDNSSSDGGGDSGGSSGGGMSGGGGDGGGGGSTSSVRWSEFNDLANPPLDDDFVTQLPMGKNAPCEEHKWKNCPMCEGDGAEHNPPYNPTDDFHEQKALWYNQRKEPIDVNVKDPVSDLKPFIPISRVASTYDELMHYVNDAKVNGRRIDLASFGDDLEDAGHSPEEVMKAITEYSQRNSSAPYITAHSDYSER